MYAAAPHLGPNPRVVDVTGGDVVALRQPQHAAGQHVFLPGGYAAGPGQVVLPAPPAAGQPAALPAGAHPYVLLPQQHAQAPRQQPPQQHGAPGVYMMLLPPPPGGPPQ